MEASQVKVHDIPNLNCPPKRSRSFTAAAAVLFALCVWSFHPRGCDGFLSSLARISRMA